MKFKRLILGLVLFVFIFGVIFAFANNSKAYATSNEETNETKIYWSANDLYNSQAGVRKEPNPDNANEPIVEKITQNNTISGITLNVTEGTNPKNYGEVGWLGRKLYNDGNEENGFVFSTELGTITNIRICFREFYSDYLLKNPSAGWTKKTHTYDYDNTSEYAYEILWEGTPSKEVILRGENIDIDLYGIEFTVKGDFNVSKINYDLNGGKFIDLEVCESFNNPQTTYIEGVETLLSTNVGNKYGYKFVGWCTDKELTNDIKTVPANATGDKVYYAKYEEVPKHNIIYHLDGGEFVGEYPNTFYENFSLKLPSNVIKEGVGFYRWKDENENFITEYDGRSEEDLELWAEYRNVYKVTYHLNGGTWPENAKIDNTYVEGIGLTNIDDFNNWPVKDGKSFAGWYTDEELTEPLFDEPDRTGDVELWAKWMSPGIDKRVITTEGKTVYEVDDIKITADNAGDEKGILINNENKISIDFSKVLYKINLVRIRFNGDLEYLVDTNFDYTAWHVDIYDDNAFFDVSGYGADAFEFSLKDGNLYVEEITIAGRYITSKISYVLDGGTINEEFETEYDEGLGYTLPTNVIKDGLVFTGWFDNENFEGQPIKEITKNDKGDKTFYAYFSNNPEALVELAENSINNLPEEISLSNKEEILNARSKYEALNDEQKSSFSQEILAKLVAAEEKLNTLIAKDVSDNINNLPEISAITYDNKEAIVSAREAYNTLTDAQKAKVSKEALDKLVAAENEIIDIEKSNEVGSQVNALPTSEEVSLDDAENIKAVKEAYDSLTDSQKAKLSKEAKEKLVAIITEIETLENVDNIVKELPKAENVSLDDLEKVKKARETYNALTDSQKTKLGESNNVIIAIEKKLAGLVDDLIVNLGSVDEITLDNKNDILTAREFYESLTEEQKAYVSEEHLNLLKALEAKCIELQDAFDTEVANDATSDINELPSADEINLDNKEQLDAVKEKYESLTEGQKEKISKETKEKLEAAIAEIEAIESVYIKLDNLKTNISLEDEEAILQARASYNSLTPAQQQKIPADVVDKLESAEETITIIKAINPVKDSIENLGVIIYNSETKAKIDAARAAYNALTEDQKALVSADTLKALTDAEDLYAKLEADNTKAQTVVEKINAIGDVQYNDQTKAKIDAARLAYDQLTDAQKALVNNTNTLTNAEDLYATKKTNADAAKAVEAKINAIGKVQYNAQTKAKIDEAKKAYNALTADQKALVTNNQTLTKAETTYDDVEAVYTKINAIRTVEYTDSSKEDIDRAREAYNSLSDEEKALVSADTLKTLTQAETQYTELENGNNTSTTWTIGLSVVGGVILLSAVVLLVIYGKKEGKAEA